MFRGDKGWTLLVIGKWISRIYQLLIRLLLLGYHNRKMLGHLRKI
jgi:hypothetical protein